MYEYNEFEIKLIRRYVDEKQFKEYSTHMIAIQKIETIKPYY